jgi:hypothetical protein
VKFTPEKKKKGDPQCYNGFTEILPETRYHLMAIIPQKILFDWNEIEELGDLERLRLVLDYMPDEELMRTLEKKRAKGRNDYPVRAMWNILLAGVVFQHTSIESLRRELSRNGQLRYLCGLQGKVPSSAAFTRFLKKLIKHRDHIEKILRQLVRQMVNLLPDFGKHLAIDSKAISSFGNKPKKGTPDGRRDTDADRSKKVYRGKTKDGGLWEKVVKWFGYKLHLLVDTTYELPVVYHVTKASASDITEAHKLIDNLEENWPDILENAETLSGDKAYDDTEFIQNCHDKHNIKTVIDIRDMWKDGEETRVLNGKENVVYNYKGDVFCYCPVTNKQRSMVHGGYEKDRETLKKLCPAKQYGITCKGYDKCPVSQGIRIPLSEDRRVFTAIDRSSYKWEKMYKKRTSVERVNSRLDVSFGFEVHTIRGIKKMNARCDIALCVMLGMAIGRIKENQEDKMRCLVAAV